MRKTMLFASSLVLLLFAANRPASAQILKGLTFTTSFPFYVGDAKMPAGSYRITQVEIEDDVLSIQSQDGRRTALISFVPTESAAFHSDSDTEFDKYGNAEFLSAVWVEGQRYGMKILPTNTEKRMLASAGPVKRSSSATGN